MISLKPASEDGKYNPATRAIRAKYSQSGLYPNDGSTTPLWTTAYRCEECEVYIAPDAKHVVFANDWISTKDIVGMATFFEDGKPLADYKITELTSCLHLKCLLCGGFPRRTSSVFDTDKMTYRVSTSHGERFVFDVTTGRLSQHVSPFPAYGIGAGIMLTGGLILVCWTLRRKRAA